MLSRSGREGGVGNQGTGGDWGDVAPDGGRLGRGRGERSEGERGILSIVFKPPCDFIRNYHYIVDIIHFHSMCILCISLSPPKYILQDIMYQQPGVPPPLMSRPQSHVDLPTSLWFTCDVLLLRCRCEYGWDGWD
jgi:hypothetical protein